MDQEIRPNDPTIENETIGDEVTENQFEIPGFFEGEPQPESEPQPEVQEHPKGRVAKKKKKRKKNTNWLARIFIFLIVVAVAIAILHIDYFTVDQVNITGNTYLTEKQVLKGTKVKTGKNIFDIITFVEEGKMEKNPYIEEAKVRRDLPNIINVEIKEPVGMAQFQWGKKFVVTDNEGKVIEVAGVQREIPLVEGVQVKKAEAGSTIELAKGQEKNFNDALKILKKTEECDMFFKKLVVNDGRVTAYIFDKLKVEGSVKNLMDSLEADTLRTVVYDLYQKDTKKGTIYVSADNYCSFTPK